MDTAAWEILLGELKAESEIGDAKKRLYLTLALVTLERWRAGDFTADEIHNFCHKLPECVPLDEFKRGCEEYQQKLYGAMLNDVPSKT